MTDSDLVVQVPDGYLGTLGRALWMLEDCRDRTLSAIAGMTDTEVSSVPPVGGNSIGALLYHIAAIEDLGADPGARGERRCCLRSPR